MQSAVVVCGDVHATPDTVGPFGDFLDHLATRRPARLVLLGDIFAYWIDTPSFARRQGVVVGRLRRLAARGWRIDYLLGNRELLGGRHLAGASGARVRDAPLDLEIGGRRMRFDHGDRLAPEPWFRLWLVAVRGWWMRFCVGLVPGRLLELVARGLRWYSDRRQTGGRSRRFPRPDPSLVRRRAAGADQLLVGHFHRQTPSARAGGRLVILGDWSGGAWRWGEVDGAGRLVLHERSAPGLAAGLVTDTG